MQEAPTHLSLHVHIQIKAHCPLFTQSSVQNVEAYLEVLTASIHYVIHQRGRLT